MRLRRPALLLVFALTLAAAAQQPMPHPDYVQPGPRDTVLGGNRLQQNVTCNGNAVYVQGQQNEVYLRGTCTFVRVQGNGNHVWIEHETAVAVEGNENLTYVADTRTRVSARGNGNRFEQRR